MLRQSSCLNALSTGMRLLQSQGGVSGPGSFGETTCGGRGLCLTLQVAKRAKRLQSGDSPISNSETDCGFPPARIGLCLHGKEGRRRELHDAIPYAF